MNDNPDGTFGTLMIHPKITINRFSDWKSPVKDLLPEYIKTIGFELDVEVVITKMNTLTFSYYYQSEKIKYPIIEDLPISKLSLNRFEFGMKFYLHGLRQ